MEGEGLLCPGLPSIFGCTQAPAAAGSKYGHWQRTRRRTAKTPTQPLHTHSRGGTERLCKELRLTPEPRGAELLRLTRHPLTCAGYKPLRVSIDGRDGSGGGGGGGGGRMGGGGVE